ncbi:hypothetical protein [uncultured Fibrella sp.]|uniref:hypothetical protein n=1 Tax=uncultured Fibrella sp. TaxID=1284596 RepID=UPI0035CB2B96
MKHQSIAKAPALLFLFLTYTIGTLTSCQDHREEVEPVRFRLKKTVSTSAIRGNTKDTTTILYTYNAKGQLGSETSVETSTYGPLRYVKNATFTYNAQGQLTQINAEYSGNFSGFDRTEYTYDSAGNIMLETKLRNFDKSQPSNYQVIDKTEYTYDGSLFPATATNSYGTTRYTYLNGNISSKIVQGSTLFQYDDKPNPYYGVIRADGILSRLFSVNNQIDIGIVEPRHVLTYNAAGLLVRLNIVYRPSFPYNYDEQTTYEYEAY